MFFVILNKDDFGTTKDYYEFKKFAKATKGIVCAIEYDIITYMHKKQTGYKIGSVLRSTLEDFLKEQGWSRVILNRIESTNK